MKTRNYLGNFIKNLMQYVEISRNDICLAIQKIIKSDNKN